MQISTVSTCSTSLILKVENEKKSQDCLNEVDQKIEQLHLHDLLYTIHETPQQLPELPQDIFRLIFLDDNLEIKDFKTIRLVCKEWHAVMNLLYQAQHLRKDQWLFRFKLALKFRSQKESGCEVIQLVMKSAKEDYLFDAFIFCINILHETENKNNIYQALKTIIQLCFSTKSQRDRLISWGLSNHYFDFIEFLYEAEFLDPSAKENQVLHFILSHSSKLDFFKKLLQDPHVNPSANDNHLIMNASMLGKIEYVQELLKDPRVDPRVCFQIPALMQTIQLHYPEVFTLLEQAI